MNEITIELTDEVLDLLNHICESEGYTWDEFVSIMVRYFSCGDNPYSLRTYESFID